MSLDSLIGYNGDMIAIEDINHLFLPIKFYVEMRSNIDLAS
jgi:hypothetical protein